METKISFRKFTFTGIGDGDSDKECLEVSIPEVLDGQYGMYVWPSAPVLAQYIWYHRNQVIGKNVLELGAGTSLPGIVAAKCGAKVILSDAAQLPQCLQNCKRSCEVNDLQDVSVEGITWGEFSPNMFTLPAIDLLLAADCFYDTKDFENVIVSVNFLLKSNPRAKFWCTYQERNSDWSIESLLNKWKLECKHITLSSFEADGDSIADSNLPGNHSIWMMEMNLK
ncbi:histone-arginine methyltransferase METTL23-like [Glandiceps talaboti]